MVNICSPYKGQLKLILSSFNFDQHHPISIHIFPLLLTVMVGCFELLDAPPEAI